MPCIIPFLIITAKGGYSLVVTWPYSVYLWFTEHEQFSRQGYLVYILQKVILKIQLLVCYLTDGNKEGITSTHRVP